MRGIDDLQNPTRLEKCTFVQVVIVTFILGQQGPTNVCETIQDSLLRECSEYTTSRFDPVLVLK
jgi:hypothetical protein